MGLKTGSIRFGRNDPAEDGYEFCNALRAMGEDTLTARSSLYLTSAWWMLYIAGMRKPVVLWESTKTSLPTAMASMTVEG